MSPWIWSLIGLAAVVGGIWWALESEWTAGDFDDAENEPCVRWEDDL